MVLFFTAKILRQSFFFDWDKPGQPIPIPVTEQCEIIHITWSRSTAIGPNPTAPYYLQVYTSAYTIPFIIPVGDVLSYDWAVPFSPGTLVSGILFDKFGNTGGCQATYTVIPSSSTPNCANITFASSLGVEAVVENGPMSQFGWVDQVAPALHPPYNITTLNNEAINWTVSLSWASPFFISLVDANGNMWANGPLHAGGGGTIACLAGNSTLRSDTEVKLPIAIGASVGALAVGLVFGILGAFTVLQRRQNEKIHSQRFVEAHPAPMGTPRVQMFEEPHEPAQSRPLTTVSSFGNFTNSITNSNPSSRVNRGQGLEEHYAEFSTSDEQGRSRAITQNFTPNHRGAISSIHESIVGPSAPAAQNLYVLHHDSQIPPVTIYHQEGTQVVELPPRYPPISPERSEAFSERRMANDSPSEGSGTTGTGRNENIVLQQSRYVGPVRKVPKTP
ncbi:hypothetical protein JR316_0000756 [Psilocybe cubensis]|uniref:Uncharacterized protein n=1 Tax=Psilocybe cubensis TaxID=181762 RepID=A0ACB8HFR9_PSICU|nr:hypothetical protein JR316_0000756 [Psilocybe cubensis]KAH9486691.1 hypothetical protein JR316_0000756 [Psilocybe cubensis]